MRSVLPERYLAAAQAIKKDVPSAVLRSYKTSHLALEEYGEEIAEEIRQFLRPTN